VEVILFGPPGAGKGTQAGRVSQSLGIPHVSTGDIFRKHLREGTQLGELARSYMDRGELVPDAVVFKLVASRLVAEDALGGVLFDGFPRTVTQAELLTSWLDENDRSIGAVINLVVDDDRLIERLTGRRGCRGCGAGYHVLFKPPAAAGVCDDCGGAVVQRDDDNEQTVKNRLVVYHKETAPVLAWLRRAGRVIDVDADQPIDRVGEVIQTALIEIC